MIYNLIKESIQIIFYTCLGFLIGFAVGIITGIIGLERVITETPFWVPWLISLFFVIGFYMIIILWKS